MANMNYPPVDVLNEKCGNQYALSIVAAKRAKELLQGQRPLVEVEEGDKVISIAAKEIYLNKVYPIFED